MESLTDTFVPSWVALALAVATVAMLAGIIALVRRSSRIAKRGNDSPDVADKRAERRLFIAAVIPTLLVIGAVMAISFVGLASFARHDMGWNSWLRFIVPISLDGISITFGFWAFVAVKRGRHPGRSEKIVFIGALISAAINFNHGRQEWTGAAGLYLGFLSLASGWMFHELLSQFMDAQDDLPKARRHGVPMFGERWLWAPLSTLMARRAWVVFPPAEGLESSPANALRHWSEVRTQRAVEKGTRKTRHQVAVAAVHRELTSTTDPVPMQVQARAEVRQDDQATQPKLSPSPIPVPAPLPAPTPVPAAAAKVSTAAPLPANLLANARRAAQEHLTTHGTQITRDDMRAALRVSNQTAGEVMRAINLDTAFHRPIVNGAAVSPLTGKPLL